MALTKYFKKAVTPSFVPIEPVSHESKKELETYQNWGKRICATVSGSSMALVPFLHNVYNYVYREQADNEEIQIQKQNQIKTEITQCQNDIDFSNQQINDHLQKVEDYKDLLNQLKDERTKLIATGKRSNPEAKAKMILGCVILIPLTFYLFLFYSSTFFSGFLAAKNAIKDAAGAMFNAHCFDIVWNDSVPEFFFMICFPVIFLGLGFGLHFFSMEKSKMKYLKMTAIVLVTFLFDCILAYKIGEKIHEYMVNNDLVPEKAYSISMALSDVNTWAVIFCGFIAYIIWGIVFDQSMEAYSNLNQNDTEKKTIEDKMKTIEEDIKQEQASVQGLHAKINGLKNKIADLTSQLHNKIYIDKAAIKTEMGNFFSGWIAQMGFLGCSHGEQEEAKIAYQKTIETLLN